MEMNDLIRESWRIYTQFEDQRFLVRPSIPILYFGDHKRYVTSKLKVITLGLNPSKAEFPKENRFRRFSNARSVFPRIVEGTYYGEYLQALNGYFWKPANDPYEKWFNSFNHLLPGLDCSYYADTPNTALHTDICSPLATCPTWSKLLPEERHCLIECGLPLWHSLVEMLSPDLIIASVARSHLRRISFPQQEGWRVVHTVQRAKPYNVELTRIKIADDKSSWLVFGQAAQTPFGRVSYIDRRKIGLSLRDYIRGFQNL